MQTYSIGDLDDQDTQLSDLGRILAQQTKGATYDGYKVINQSSEKLSVKFYFAIDGEITLKKVDVRIVKERAIA